MIKRKQNAADLAMVEEVEKALAQMTLGEWRMFSCHAYSVGENGANVFSVGSPRKERTVGFSPMDLDDPDRHEAHANMKGLVLLRNNAARLIALARKGAEKP